jgi:hypothetical protein
MRHTITTAVAAVVLVAPVFSQQEVRRRVFTTNAEGTVVGFAEEQLARTAVESRITRGAPYSAEAVTESIQLLGDGNRIVQRNVVRVFRDSEGRTRREQLGQNGEVETINITDPVAESMYVLNPRTREAHRNGVIMASPSGAVTNAATTPFGDGVVTATKAPDGSVSVEARSGETASAGGRGAGAGPRGGGGGGAAVPQGRSGGGVDAVAGGRGGARGRVGGWAPNANREDLGEQVIEGVIANGTRSTTVYEVGAIGNEQPMKIISEQWLSPHLQVLVMTRHSDPRRGETTYRLTNILLSEPAKTLFEVPADYTLKDSVIRRYELR